jgi:hypothetical protein
MLRIFQLHEIILTYYKRVVKKSGAESQEIESREFNIR